MTNGNTVSVTITIVMWLNSKELADIDNIKRSVRSYYEVAS